MAPRDLAHRPNKERELDPYLPAGVGLFQFRTPIRRKLEDSEKHKRRIFSYDGRTIFWDFVGLNFSLVKFLWANPLARAWKAMAVAVSAARAMVMAVAAAASGNGNGCSDGYAEGNDVGKCGGGGSDNEDCSNVEATATTAETIAAVGAMALTTTTETE
jgi:hypothetical protein